ncbi:MAG: flagellar FliJ family protein [Rhodospirillaceae bacterium]
MTDLRPLIRFHKWQLDEKQRALAELRNHEDRILADSARLEEEIKAEQRTAGSNYEVAFGYGAFARAAIGRRQLFARALAEVRDRIALAAEDLAEAFREVKTYELAQEERDKRLAEERRHKENLTLDETAQIGHRRREEEKREPE